MPCSQFLWAVGLALRANLPAPEAPWLTINAKFRQLSRKGFLTIAADVQSEERRIVSEFSLARTAVKTFSSRAAEKKFWFGTLPRVANA
jgi:hypothetical protein